MSVYQDLFGTWGGILTVFIVAMAALGIPAGIALVLNREIKGPAETHAIPRALVELPDHGSHPLPAYGFGDILHGVLRQKVAFSLLRSYPTP